MFRQEAKTTLWNLREVIAGIACVCVGIWFLSQPGNLLALPGIALGVAGTALIWIGVQRARFRRDQDGQGAVQVDESEITYFGPISGGAVSLREMTALAIDGSMRPAHWRLEQAGQAPLLIPVNAVGADALFDAFAALPGLRTEKMLSELNANPDQIVLIWQRQSAPSKQVTLH